MFGLNNDGNTRIVVVFIYDVSEERRLTRLQETHIRELEQDGIVYMMRAKMAKMALLSSYFR